MYFGETKSSHSLYYTAPSRVTAKDDYAGLATMRLHINQIEKPWIWVIDCANMELHNFYNARFASFFTDVLETTPSLLHVLIVNPNIWIYRVLKNIPQTLDDMIHVSKTDLELAKLSSYLEFSFEAKTWLKIAFLRDPNQKLDVVT